MEAVYIPRDKKKLKVAERVLKAAGVKEGGSVPKEMRGALVFYGHFIYGFFSAEYAKRSIAPNEREQVTLTQLRRIAKNLTKKRG